MAAARRLAVNPFPPNVAYVDDFASLLAYEFAGSVNAVCWRRNLVGDFDALLALLPPVDDITSLDREDLAGLPVTASGHQAREQLVRDLDRLMQHGLQPSLDLVPAGPGRRNPGPIRTDVGDWHADSATAAADTFLCTYAGAPSEGIHHDDVVNRAEDPASLAQLRELYGGGSEAGFRQFLTDQFYDLHYREKPDARIFTFGQGHLWKIATRYPGCPVPPCIHRAPATPVGAPPRLLLIS